MTNTANIPAYLREHGLFCLWKYEERDGRRTKMPYNPNSPQERAKTNDPGTFAPLETATARAGGFDGLGIGIFDGIAGIDIDHCITGGKLSAMAQDIVNTMDAYTEISPSGEGLRILFLAPGFKYDSGRYYIKESKQGLEVYIPGMTQRYLTVTGNPLPGSASDMVNRADRLQSILDKYMKRPQAPQIAPKMPGTPADISDIELIEKAKQAKNGGQFSELWAGNYGAYPSHSEADLALCNLLAFWTGRNASRMDALFRQSGLMRTKWDRRQSGTTYGAITIQQAIANCTEVYNPPQERPQGAQTGGSPAPVVVVSTTEPNAPQEAAQPRKTALQLFDEFIGKVQTEAYRPLKTGMPAFDMLLGGGIMRQSLVILTAAPGSGKTSLAQQIFEEMAKSGADVIFLNLEMSREQLLARSLSRIAQRRGHNMTAGDIMRGYAWTEQQRAFVMQAAEEYRTRIAPWMQYNPEGCGTNLDGIIATLETAGQAAQAEGKPAPVCVLDYLHLVTTMERQEQSEILKKTIAALKGYAIKYDTFVFAISANNRAANSSGIISQDSGRDTSAIEYTADVMLSLNYRELAEKEKKDNGETYRASDPEDMRILASKKPRNMVVQVLKHRLDETGGKLYLDYDAAHSTFTPVDRHAIPPAYRGSTFTPLPDNDPDNPFL